MSEWISLLKTKTLCCGDRGGGGEMFWFQSSGGTLFFECYIPEPMNSLDLSLLANGVNWVVYFPFWQLSGS